MKLTLICLLAGTLILTGCVQKPVPPVEEPNVYTPSIINTNQPVRNTPATVKEYLKLHKYKIRKDGRKYRVWDGNGNLLLDASVAIVIDNVQGNVYVGGTGSLFKATINDVTFIINADGSMEITVKNIGTARLTFDAAGNLSSIEDQ